MDIGTGRKIRRLLGFSPLFTVLLRHSRCAIAHLRASEGRARNDGDSLIVPAVPRFHPLMFTIFRGGRSGAWRVTRFGPVRGASLAPTPSLLSVVQSLADRSAIMPSPDRSRGWPASPATSLYRARRKEERLDADRAEIGRPEATYAALIPIKKSATWWELTQEERRQIFEDRSHHIANSLKYLPAVARQLYHCRDLGEPFDFLTWFEYAPARALGIRFAELAARCAPPRRWRYASARWISAWSASGSMRADPLRHARA